MAQLPWQDDAHTSIIEQSRHMQCSERSKVKGQTLAPSGAQGTIPQNNQKALSIVGKDCHDLDITHIYL